MIPIKFQTWLNLIQVIIKYRVITPAVYLKLMIMKLVKILLNITVHTKKVNMHLIKTNQWIESVNTTLIIHTISSPE